MTTETKRLVQFLCAVAIILVGIVLLFFGFFAVPIGEIASSVLTAVGECFTFAGSLWGIERTYAYKTEKLDYDYKTMMRNDNK